MQFDIYISMLEKMRDKTRDDLYNILNNSHILNLHWKPINYKTWVGILYAHDFNGQ